jgi:hypothetical protein
MNRPANRKSLAMKDSGEHMEESLSEEERQDAEFVANRSIGVTLSELETKIFWMTAKKIE